MKKQIIFFALLLASMTLAAQVRNPFEMATNNEDEVVHLEQWQQHAAKPLQAIVKLQDYSNYTIVAPKPGASGKSSDSGSSGRITCPAIQQVLEGYVIESIEQLCPTFVMPKEPRRSASYGGGEVRDHDLSQMYLITLSEESPKREYELIEELSALDEVEFAEPNYLVFALGSPDIQDLGNPGNVADATYCASPKTIDAPLPDINLNGRKTSGVFTPNDPMYSLQWGIPACGIDSLLTAPKRDSAWRPVICILDTGVDPDHPDLADNIWTNTAEQNGAANQDDDNNGFRDDIHGWDFVNQTGDIHDFNSHGTHCAGIAGAVTNNGIGIAGACPDALIMPVAVMQSDGTGDIATIIQGINYAAQNGAEIISMSIGTYAYSIAMEQALAVAYHNAVLVAAAGNDGGYIHPNCPMPFVGPMFPGAFTFVLGVQATFQGGGLANFSNIDCDGPSYSLFSEEQLYNYELSAPGVGIMSIVPNGQYRNYNGTSMATPLVAGGIASLLQRREYLTKEILFGDLINYTHEFQPVDFWAAYNGDSIVPAILQMVALEINDTTYGDSSMYADAGERVQLYPTIRTVWGSADSVEMWLEFQEFEDTNTIQILQNHVQLGHPLSAYAKAKSINPIDIRIADNVVDGRHICLSLCAIAPNATDTLRHDFVMKVTNGVKLHGMLIHNDTLWPNVHYIVTDNYAIVDGVELVIKPGVMLKFNDGVKLSNAGKIYAMGTPDSMITFTKTDLGQGWGGIVLNVADTLGYVIIEYLNEHVTNQSSIRFCDYIFHRNYNISYNGTTVHLRKYKNALLVNSVVRNNTVQNVFDKLPNVQLSSIYSNSCVFSSWIFGREKDSDIGGEHYFKSLSDSVTPVNNNIINNYSYNGSGVGVPGDPDWLSDLWPLRTNIFNNNSFSNKIDLSIGGVTPFVTSPRGLYIGTSIESIARQHIFDFEYPQSGVFGFVDLTYMEHEPIHEAHGIVWKVEVNGYDAQDEFDSIIPLGVGTHEFKVYFNRAMDTSITPMVAMGVRPPYTQTAIGENASWSADSIIYTAHLTLTGRIPIDGLNRIYVSGAQDDEHFEIPYENLRFNVYVASSGSMSAGFQATPGIGKVDLEWNDQEVNYDDFLGFNIYRYQYDSVRVYNNSTHQYDTLWMPVDTIRLNQTLVQDTTYTDFDVVPGTRYYYFYKILSTSLTENSPSKTVSCVPNSTIPGDANGSYAVDVADVISVINYVTGQNPQPFLFEAADVNGDGVINVLDIVSIINIILHPNQQQPNAKTQYTAIYTLENDTLYINTPVDLAGLQFTLGGCLRSDIEVLPALTGFECANVEEDGNLTMLFYSMSGATVPAGKTALLRIQNANSEIQSIVLSDSQGQNVIAMNGDAVGITDIETIQAQFATAYPNPFSDKVRLEMTVGNYSRINLVFTDLMGRTVDRREVSTPTAGRYSLMWDATGLPRGIYFATLYADGQKAQTIKLVVK